MLEADLRRELPGDIAEYLISKLVVYEGGPAGALDFSAYAASVYGESIQSSA